VSVDPLARTEARIGRLLTIGTRVSTTLLAVGLALSLIVPSSDAPHRLLALGLVALMATPVARVAASVVGFFGQRDWWFVLYTSIVLALLLASIAAAVS
jgi:uncharacterized membrane protein